MRSLICNLDKPASTGSLAYSGKFPFSIGLNVTDITFANSWVIDSGATNHMNHSPNIFSTYFPYSSSRKIATANGSLTTIAGIGDVKISPSLMLKNVKKLTQDLHCNVDFYHSHCVFQDEDSGRMIGHAREWDGLYYLKAPSQLNITKGKSSHSFVSEVFSFNKEKVWLHHRRLGHSSFRVIKILFPSLFKGLNVKHFHCEVCELAKHKRVSFPPVSNKISYIPFYLIHSDIWGPSPIPNITGAKWFVSFINDCTRVT